MKCPKCGASGDTKVLDSRLVQDEKVVRRRRQCDTCSYRFTTFERVEVTSLIVTKKDGVREPYTREKVLEGIWRACSKRAVSVEQINTMMTELEEGWMKGQEVTSKQIGEDVMKQLRDLDEVAYIRFASVYRRFKDVDAFANELKEFLENK